MGQAIVRQPDGKLACFSSVSDNFTMWDATEEEAVAYCVDELDLGPNSARAMVQRGLDDLKPFSTKHGSGLDRWDDSLQTIATVHGEKVLRERMAEMGFSDYPKLDGIIKEYARPEEEEEVGDPAP
jgi:hypothetical protein